MADPRINPANANMQRQSMMSDQQMSARSGPGQARTVGQMSSYGVSRSGMGQVRPGDVVRGEISDLRNNEITITLQNNTIIKGQIADSSSLSIGQTAAFRLSALAGGGALLEAIPNSYTETELTLINKALDEAGLPPTDRNQSAVKALMNNLMPINKQSIQQLMQQAYDLDTEDMESLCLMKRQNMEITADTVAQFSSYRNATHQLIGRVQTFAAQLPQMLDALSENGPSNAVASFGERLLNIALSTPYGSDQGMMSLAGRGLAPGADGVSLPQMAPGADRISLTQTLLGEEEQALSGQMSGEEGAVPAQSADASAAGMNLQGVLRGQGFTGMDGMTGYSLQETEGELTLSGLSLADQDSIKNMLMKMPMTQEQLTGLQDGSMTQKEALSLLRDAIAGQSAVLPEDCPPGEALAKMNEISDTMRLAEPASRPAEAEGLVTLQEALAEPSPEGEGSRKAADSVMAEEPVQDKEAGKETTGGKAVPEEGTAEDGDSAKDSGKSAFQAAGRLFHSLSGAARNSLQNINQNINQIFTAPQESSVTVTHTPSVIDTLISHVAGEGQEKDFLFSFMEAGEREELARAVRSLPISSELRSQILSGDATAREVFTAIRDAVPHADSADVGQLFQSEVFQKLFTQLLMENMTITPRQLARNGQMDSFYQGVESQMNAFENLIQTTLSGSDSGELSRQAHDMKSNIDFMKALNETFGYMQLPLKLQNQNTHGELYVYTKKEKLRQNQDQISLLLHLEMDHLGTVDVRLEKDKNNVKADFKLSDEDAMHLVSRNTHMLEDSLGDKGYSCQIKVQSLEKEETPVQDFLNTKVTTQATREMKRFSFDIRA